MDDLEMRFRRDAVAAQELAADTYKKSREWMELVRWPDHAADDYCRNHAQAWQTRAAFDYKSARVMRALAYEASL
jgi:hypothetical protein